MTECAGPGNCHGCLKWCSHCGDVAHVCNTRLRGERCDAHPVPPSTAELRSRRRAAERMIAEGRHLMRVGRAELEDVDEGECARNAYDAQLALEEDT